MKKLFIALAVLLWPALAGTAQNPTSHAFKKLQTTLINDVALNAAAGTRTFALTEQDMRGYGILTVFVDFAHSAATDVQMVCSASDDQGTTDFPVQSCAVAAGVCTSTDANWTKAVAGNDEWIWRVDIVGIPYLECVFSGTSGGASDKVVVTGYLSAQ